MTNIANLNREAELINDGLDSIVVVQDLADVPGGRTLDVSELPADVEVIKAGYVLVENTTTHVVKPLAVSGNAYQAKPEGYLYFGILKHSILKKDPRAAILRVGQVNAAACPYPITNAIKEGLPRIDFIY